MNRLAAETSPYLRQHRDNPVDWYPWGDEAFAAARERDVPVLLSVGYSACHWCHVMAHESFEDDEVAAVMNDRFVNVKVDREERPDVDAVYMDAVQALTGRGGWPMTVAMDADGRPFWGGTYFPKESFLKLLAALDDVWRNRRGELEQNATALVEAIGRSATTTPQSDIPPIDLINDTLGKVAGAFDSEWGGFGQAPKFPSTHHLELILRAYMTTGADDAKTVLVTSLDAMASGGMYDHIGGGFARYSVDREWLVPHFEKMLYDQALLVQIYRQAHSVLGLPHYRQIVDETIGYVLRDLRHPDGGFFSAEDADSPDEHGHGVEGLFHTWTPDEVRAALAGMDDEAIELTLGWFDITEGGNFEGRSIPNRIGHRAQLRRPPVIEEARQRLFATRERRRRPGLDDKVLTEWNAMFLSALADAAAVLRREDWKAAAIANGEFLVRELRGPDGRWFRSWQADGQPRARHAALAADHAALVEAFVRLAELSGEARWIDAARQTADTMLDWFWDPEQGGLFTTAEDAEALVVRQKDLHDGATPSANSSAARGLQRLAALTGEQRYRNHADRILQLLGTVVEQLPGGTSNALIALEQRHRGPTELAIVGDMPMLVRLAQSVWRPDLVLAWGEPYDSPLWESRVEGKAYLCRDHVCEAPVDTVEALFEQLTGQPAPEDLTSRLGG
ncbi:MAG: thioredoxin domain-containing protein [Ilumatobacter sp.]|uniref:thioredoxin domain-containing protein n=1 Tax=Ilumatobacter sp. TaxID=1967498 RepID=UPI00262693B1|nr:thioredoxin domain-containing protein [Ilumatobacter sp.]MDJ0767531.1 thioredoxin domain-containing protein [Ilumatobacter sp.]